MLQSTAAWPHLRSLELSGEHPVGLPESTSNKPVRMPELRVLALAQVGSARTCRSVANVTRA
ncbi:hypothetical protein BD310DRAFT_940221 [Dichomitus squalens]|uniref:Uncharacterized protein n=1 Tax=Dichomitus squalens TaxID=114155 RepID=A0A4Q9PCC1_9APHY|nr:hypothetical protein BD310DRAFT_940221 [Dichomitus squalens]